MRVNPSSTLTPLPPPLPLTAGPGDGPATFNSNATRQGRVRRRHSEGEFWSLLLSPSPNSNSSLGSPPPPQQIKFFRNKDWAYVCFAMLSMKPLTCPAKDTLFEQHDVSEEVIFLQKGTVHLITRGTDVEDAAEDLGFEGEMDIFNKGQKNPCLVGMVSEGGFFGDLECRNKGPRMVAYETVSSCHMFALSRDVLESANHIYATSGKQFEADSDRRLKIFNTAMASDFVMLRNGKISKRELFVDSKLVNAQSIR